MRISAAVASAIYSSALLAGAVVAQEEAAEAVESVTSIAKPTFTVSNLYHKTLLAASGGSTHLYSWSLYANIFAADHSESPLPRTVH
jgi:hypothetical protein